MTNNVISVEERLIAMEKKVERFSKLITIADETRAEAHFKQCEKRFSELANRLQTELLKVETVSEVFRYCVLLSRSRDAEAKKKCAALKIDTMHLKLFRALEQPNEFWKKRNLTIGEWAQKISEIILD